MAHPLMQETIWFDRTKFEEAETKYQERVASKHSGLVVQKSEGPASNLVSEIARARQTIQNSLSAGVGLSVSVGVDNPELLARLSAVEKENQELRTITRDLQAAVAALTERLNALNPGSSPSPQTTAKSAPVQNGTVDEEEEDDDDDDFDCFDEVDEEKEKLTKQRLADYADKKAKKPAVIAKSNIILDVKPWGDDTDMTEVEKAVRSIQADGLLWGASKLVPLAYGINKLQISCVVEDDKVGTDFLEEEMDKFEDLIQSMDIAAFNKV